MGKTLIQQARGHGGPRYQARKRAFIFRVKYPLASGDAKILSLVHSAAHSAPLIKAKVGNEIFFNVAFNGASENEMFSVGGQVKEGNVLFVKDIPVGTHVFNIERQPGDGGKMVRAAGGKATINKHYEHNKVGLIMPNKAEIILDGSCRATIGVIAGGGRKLKPFITAGRKFYKMQAKGKLWPRTSAVKMNAIDHPFGSGRGKRIKSKIAKRWAPAGKRVGHIAPRRTGRR